MKTNYQYESKKRIYLYPITPYVYQKGANGYILNVIKILSEEFTVINKSTKLGMFDLFRKLPKCDIIYFNWIADLADKRLGYLQIPVLFFILVCSKILNIKIAWFIHNDVSHTPKNWFAKKLIRRMMMLFADVSFSHSNELSLIKKLPEIKVFDHPMEELDMIDNIVSPSYDALIWGSVSQYKGISEFVEFNAATEKLNEQCILIAGKFSSENLYKNIESLKKDNLEIVNKVVEEDELIDLFTRSRYIIFCYRSASVLSSAALCKTLSHGKTIIGPNIGAFKELGRKGLIYTYESFEELAEMLGRFKSSPEFIDQRLIKDYTQQTSWTSFKDFLVYHLNEPTESTVLSPLPTNI
jgi:beta-1,4-mannosyltransferase